MLGKWLYYMSSFTTALTSIFAKPSAKDIVMGFFMCLMGLFGCWGAIARGTTVGAAFSRGKGKRYHISPAGKVISFGIGLTLLIYGARFVLGWDHS